MFNNYPQLLIFIFLLGMYEVITSNKKSILDKQSSKHVLGNLVAKPRNRLSTGN